MYEYLVIFEERLEGVWGEGFREVWQGYRAEGYTRALIPYQMLQDSVGFSSQISERRKFDKRPFHIDL